MSRRGRKNTKSISALPLRTPIKDSSCPSLNSTLSTDYTALKRAQLQLQCKRLGLRATGKNSELVERLNAYHGGSSAKTAYDKKERKNSAESHDNPKAPHVDLIEDTKTGRAEKKTDMVQGWCVVHGMVLYRPASDWIPLFLRGGMICVQDGEKSVPFHLPPLNISVPEGMLDNYVCKDCVLRNQEKPKKCPLCQQIQRKGNPARLTQDLLKSFTPLGKNISTTPSLLATNGPKHKRRTVEIKKLYQPQEDEAYAQRVDGILSQMARGEVGVDRALRPLQPLVVHSPAPYEI